jgi:uncharacterized protein (DUF983 family)
MGIGAYSGLFTAADDVVGFEGAGLPLVIVGFAAALLVLGALLLVFAGFATTATELEETELLTCDTAGAELEETAALDVSDDEAADETAMLSFSVVVLLLIVGALLSAIVAAAEFLTFTIITIIVTIAAMSTIITESIILCCRNSAKTFSNMFFI